MAKSPTATLARLIKQLLAEREKHADAIAAIDEQFEAFGIATAAPSKKKTKRRGRRGPGRPKGAGKNKVSKKRGGKKKVVRKKAKNGRRKKTGKKKVSRKKVGKKRRPGRPKGSKNKKKKVGRKKTTKKKAT